MKIARSAAIFGRNIILLKSSGNFQGEVLYMRSSQQIFIVNTWDRTQETAFLVLSVFLTIIAGSFFPLVSISPNTGHQPYICFKSNNDEVFLPSRHFMSLIFLGFENGVGTWSKASSTEPKEKLNRIHIFVGELRTLFVNPQLSNVWF